jgi:hypothetical protein
MLFMYSSIKVRTLLSRSTIDCAIAGQPPAP